MGSQINFFLSRGDQQTVDHALKTIPNLCILKGITATSSLEELDTSELSVFGNEPLYLVLARRSDLMEFSMSQKIGPKGFTVDSTAAPIIEFNRCFIGDSFIRSGRIYSSSSFWSQGGTFRKQEDFLVWTKQVFKAVRKCLTKVGTSGYFAGDDAMQFRTEGWLFDPLDSRNL
jgi:hypothetical protein